MTSTRDRETPRKTNRIPKQSTDTEGSSNEEYQLHHVGVLLCDPVGVQVTVNSKQLMMEVDTGDALSIILESTRRAIFPEEKMRPSNLVLKSYTKDRRDARHSTLNVCVQYKSQTLKLILVVIVINQVCVAETG